MANNPEDLSAPSGGRGSRRAPSTGPVSSGTGPGAPPRRSRRAAPGDDARGGPPTVAASIPADSLPEAVLDDGGRELEAEPRRQRPRGRAASVGGRTTAPRAERQFRQTVVKVDLWSVTKLSLCFYLSAMFVTLVALIALWVIADAAGIIGDVETFIGDLLSAEDDSFQFLSGEVLRGTILIGLVVAALQVVVTVVAASFYNVFSELFGGLEITVKEEDASR